MNTDNYDNPDDVIAAASRLDMRGEWAASINLYRRVADRWPEHREYVQRCIDRVTEKKSLDREQQNSSCPLRENTRKDDAPDGATSPRRGIRGSVIGALILLAWDVGLTGSFLMSFLGCPVWFLGAILKNTIERPGWRLALLRIAVPLLVLAFVLANDTFQRKIAEANAPRIIAACEEFQADNGEFPESLDELVPSYIPSIPPAKYCLTFGEFRYWNRRTSPMLVWYVVPPYGRAIYSFEERRWSYLD